MKQALRDLLCPQPKSKIKAGDGQSEGTYNFYTSSQIQSKFYHTATYMQPALIFGTGGMASVHFCEKPFSTSTDCLVMYAKQSVNLELIYHYLSSNIHILQAGFKGAGLQHISKDYILDIEIDMPDIATQDKICSQMRQLDTLIENRKTQLTKLDQLVKSQFMEQFGDPKQNEKGLPIMKIGEFASVKGGKRLPKGEAYADGVTEHPYVRVIDMVNHSVTIPALVYLTQTTHEKIARYIISSKDIYISIAGTIGQVGAIPDSIDGANLTENAAKIVLAKDAPIDRDYLIWYLSLPAGAEQIEEKTMHTTQPKLALYRIEEIEVLVPSIDEQKQFAAFVEQTDKSKLAIQKSLDELETLKKALMQQYFG